MPKTDERTVNEGAVSLLAEGVVALALKRAKQRIDDRREHGLPLATSAKGSVGDRARGGQRTKSKRNS